MCHFYDVLRFSSKANTNNCHNLSKLLQWDFTKVTGSIWVLCWTMFTFGFLCAVMRSQVNNLTKTENKRSFLHISYGLFHFTLLSTVSIHCLCIPGDTGLLYCKYLSIFTLIDFVLSVYTASHLSYITTLSEKSMQL